MRFSPCHPRLPLCLLIAGAFALTGCASTASTTMILAALNCEDYLQPVVLEPCQSPLIPSPTTTDPVTGALTITEGQSDTYSDAQAYALEKCNNARASVVHIMRTCQAQQEKILQDLKPKPWYESLLGR